jgi:hypothetical protein
MDSTTLAILGTLAGAVVATTGTVLAQRLSGRDAERRASAERSELRRESRRTELRRATESFFIAAEHAQSASDPAVTESEKRSASDQLWAAFKTLALMSSDRLRDAAARYSDGLNETLWSPDTEPAWKRVFEANRDFTAAARDELGSYDF